MKKNNHWLFNNQISISFPGLCNSSNNVDWLWSNVVGRHVFGDSAKHRPIMNRPIYHLARLDTPRHVRLCRASRDERVQRDEYVEPCFSNIADDEEAVVLACTSLVCRALSVHVNKTEKDDTLCGWKTIWKNKDFWMLQFSSDVRFNESKSDLVKLHAHRHRAVWGTF